MRIQNLETKIMQTIEIVESGSKVEDQTLELKAKFGDNTKQIARQLAGHANSARSDRIIWIIGIDEEEGVKGVDDTELANWWPEVEKHFSSVKPVLETNVVKKTDNGTVVGLCFRTEQAPYLVNNPNGGPIAREVPWREGNRTRTARRDDLLKLLVPRMNVPDIEVLSAVADITYNDRVKELIITAELYIYASSNTTITIPYHRCRLYLLNNDSKKEYEVYLIAKRNRIASITKNTPGSMITHTRSEVIVNGSGSCVIMAGVNPILKTMMEELRNHPLQITLSLFCHELEQTVSESAVLKPTSVNGEHQVQWSYGRPAESPRQSTSHPV